MDGEPAFLAEPEGTREEIMRATYWALIDHGYADLTISRIGDHFEKSQSLLYHHYEGKDELLLEFLSFMLESFEESLPQGANGDPAARLEAVLDFALAPELSAEHRQFESAMAELKAQGVTDDRFREHFSRHDHFFRVSLARIIRAGVEDGTFRDVDPTRTASFVFTVIEGVRSRRATTDDVTVERVRMALDDYLETVLHD